VMLLGLARFECAGEVNGGNRHKQTISLPLSRLFPDCCKLTTADAYGGIQQ
jgi:hypothetical protein